MGACVPAGDVGVDGTAVGAAVGVAAGASGGPAVGVAVSGGRKVTEAVGVGDDISPAPTTRTIADVS
jgi:hypothetical protein